jgi:ATP-dependent DNA helicase RecG
MSTEFLLTPIEYLKGVGPQRGDLFKSELGIKTFQDLLNHFPFRYVDRTKFVKINEISSEEINVQLKARVTNVKEAGEGRVKRLIATVMDDTGSLDLVWFKGIKWIKPSLKLNSEFIIYGKPNRFGSSYNIAHPELEEVSKAKVVNALQAIYHTTEKASAKGLGSKGIEKVVKSLVVQLNKSIPENLSVNIKENMKLLGREEAYKQIHVPASYEGLKKAIFRIKFEEFFFLQLRLLKQKQVKEVNIKGHVFDVVGDTFSTFYNTKLKFELTNAQKRVIKEIRRDIGSGKHMNRLLQGDVGSGKTIVALLVMLLAIDNGFQACMMAPTEILATQHYATIVEYLEGMDVSVSLLTGSSKKSQRTIIHENLQSGKLNILVGTHALLEDVVQFNNLGIAIIDEQHRFGVKQRARLWKKSMIPPHILVMTATPIPRTLAMTFYGDLDISVIDELPPGRKEIKTVHKFDSNRLSIFGFIEKQIAEGRQIYVVYPLIEESDKMDFKDLMDGYESLSRRFPLPKYQISIVHGKMKSQAKELEMQRFVEGKTQILVATTVIEVGVNVPNASVMIIESANKFGLSQLHQLRGRVGRGASQSFCILMTDYKLSIDAKTRIETMVSTNDGFEIAETDLKLRGPGDMLGTQQSGVLDFKLADLAKDNKILVSARNQAIDVLANDNELVSQENYLMRKYLADLIKRKPNWGRIS